LSMIGSRSERDASDARGVDSGTAKKLSRGEFLRTVLGMGGVALAALVLTACVPGEEDDDEEEDDDD
jgi:hypothetical protein